MFNIYEFDNYKKFMQNWLQMQPKKGRGLAVKISEYLSISTVLFSQIFNGDKNLSLEHSILLADYLGLQREERGYFLLLVNYEKAGSQKLRDHFRIEIKSIQELKLENLKEIIKQDIKLGEADKAIFYSSWLYSAIRLQVSIDGFNSVDKIAEKFSIPRQEALKKLEFLVEKKLCVLDKTGYQMGPQRTHLEADSPFVKQRQISWRLKAFEKMEQADKNQLFYTAPMSISKEHYVELRKRITEVIAELNQKVTEKKPEKLSVLNIDLFDL